MILKTINGVYDFLYLGKNGRIILEQGAEFSLI